MNIGVIISSNDTETCWNALRYANFALDRKDAVKVFFMGKGVGRQIHRIRGQEASEACPISTMKDMHEIVEESDKVLAF